VETSVKKKALKPSAENFKVVKAALGNKAGIVGAAALARAQLKK
jgi:hypothetical protein